MRFSTDSQAGDREWGVIARAGVVKGRSSKKGVMSESKAPPATALRRELSFADLIVYGLCYIAPMTPLTIIGFVWQASNSLIVLVYLL